MILNANQVGSSDASLWTLARARRLVVECWLLILHAGAHTVHGLALMGALMSHHRGRRPTWAGESARPAAHRLRWCGTRRHELGVTAGIHGNVRAARYHSVRTPDELGLHHDVATHMRRLLRHELGIVGIAPELRRVGVHVGMHHRLVVLHLGGRVHRRGVVHGDLVHPGRGEGLRRGRVDHALVIAAGEGCVGGVGGLAGMNGNGRHVGGLPKARVMGVVGVVLEVEG